MGLFSAPKVPSTISDRQMADLRRRAAKTQHLIVSPRAAKARQADARQRARARWS